MYEQINLLFFTANLLENTDGGYSDPPPPIPPCSLGAAACYLLVLLTGALLMTSSHSEGTLPEKVLQERRYTSWVNQACTPRCKRLALQPRGKGTAPKCSKTAKSSAGRKRETFLPRFCSRTLMDCVAPLRRGGATQSISALSMR